MNEENQKKIDEYEAEIRCIESDFRASTDIGDYKIMKIYEARLKGEADPYDVDTVIANRVEARSRINELQQLIQDLEDAG